MASELSTYVAKLHLSTRVSYVSVPQECCARAHKTELRVSKIVWALVFKYVFAFGFVGSIFQNDMLHFNESA